MTDVKTVPDRVDNFGSDNAPVSVARRTNVITPDNLETHAEFATPSNGVSYSNIAFRNKSAVTKGGIHLAKAN